MKAYYITFEGIYLGGTAIIIASSKKKVLEKLIKDNPNKKWVIKEAKIIAE